MRDPFQCIAPPQGTVQVHVGNESRTKKPCFRYRAKFAVSQASFGDADLPWNRRSLCPAGQATESIMRVIPYAAAIVMVAGPAAAQASDPAARTVQSLDDALIATMKAGASAGMKGRMAKIGPAIDTAFDVPLMTRLAIGPSWTSIGATDQQALVAAFRRMTIAQYADNFDGFSGQSFVIQPNVETRGGDKLVRTTLKDPKGDDVAIAYRLRPSGGGWKIIDVFYKNSISQIATRRSDFAAILQKGGAKALIAHLNALAAKAGG